MTRRRWAFALQCLVSVLLLALLFRGLDIRALRSLLATQPLWFYAFSLAVVVAGQLLYAWRWRQLLAASGVPVRLRLVIQQYFVGIFLNNFFPSTVGGDVAKIYYLGREHGFRPVAASIVLDRMLSIAVLAVLAAIMHWIAPDPSPRFTAARAVVMTLAVALIGISVLALRGTGGLPARLSFLGKTVVAVAEWLQRFRLEMAAAARHRIIFLQSALVVVTYFTVITVVYEIFVVLNTGTRLPFLTLLTAITTASLLSNLPVSVNGLGLREQLHVVLLQPLGVSREAAVAISLLLFAHLLVSSVFGLLLWLRLPAPPENFGAPVVDDGRNRYDRRS